MRYTLTVIALAAAFSASAATRIVNGEGTVSLDNGLTSVKFSTDKCFDILSMKHNGSRELVTPENNLNPWTITYLGAQGETPEVNPACTVYRGATASRTDSSAVVRFHWDTRLVYDGGTYPVEMTVSLPDNSPLLEWNITAALPEGWKVSEIKFPTVAISSPEEAAKVITPAGWGNEYKLRADTI